MPIIRNCRAEAVRSMNSQDEPFQALLDASTSHEPTGWELKSHIDALRGDFDQERARNNNRFQQTVQQIGIIHAHIGTLHGALQALTQRVSDLEAEVGPVYRGNRGLSASSAAFSRVSVVDQAFKKIKD